MKKNYFLAAAAFLLSMGAQAQIQDVTSSYIQDPGFEECTPLEADADGIVYLIADYSNPGGTDYADNGWTLVAQKNSANSGVINYGVTVKYSQWAAFPCSETAPEGSVGNKGLCFVGSDPVAYQTDEVELPSGYYRLTTKTYVYSGWAATSGITNRTGFVANDGTTYLSKKTTFNSNAVDEEGNVIKDADGNLTHIWDGDTIEILLPAPVKGHFQLSYGAGFFTVIDDVKLEYEARVITTALEEKIVKAKALSKELYDSDPELTAAIQAAEAFVANPTTQDDVDGQIQLLAAAMNTALENTFEPVDLSTSYVENFSFETGSIAPWVSQFAATATPPGWIAVKPAIDGNYYAYFAYNATEWTIEQTVSGLPAGYYYVQALLEGTSKGINPVTLFLNDTETTVTPLSDADYSKHFGQVVYFNGGSAKIGAKADAEFNIDAIRLIFCTDEDVLNEGIYNTVVADATAVLNDEGNAIITGEERTALQTAIESTEGSMADRIDAINAAVSAFSASKASYQAFETAKTAAAAYTMEAYPYADPAIYEEIQTLCATVATSGSDAVRLSQQLTYTCQKMVDSHFALEGVTDKVNYTAQMGEWTLDLLQADPDREGFFIQTTEFQKGMIASMEQTLSGLPVGKYAFVCESRANYSTVPTVLVNGNTVETLPHTGVQSYVSGVGYVDNWAKTIVSFDKGDGGELTLRIEANHSATYGTPEFGIGNMLLFKVADLTEFTEQINVERIIDQGYAAQNVTVDLAAAKEFLGVDQLTTSMLRIVNPDGTQISDYAPYDGWFDREGKAEYWGPNTFTCVKFFQAIPSGTYAICDMGGDRGSVAPVVGDEFSCKWALTANDKTYIFQTNVTYVEAPPVEKTVVDLGIVASVEYDPAEASYVEKTVTLTDEQVNAILTELELSSLTEATVYGYNPTTEELIENYAGYDGWRDANGDFRNWTGNSTVPACVKYTDGKTYYCYNINGCEPQVIKCYWAIANDTKAVLVEIDFIYLGDTVGISDINILPANNQIYDLQGRQVNSNKKGIFIQNGHKVVK